jgi:hypothetical protein
VSRSFTPTLTWVYKPQSTLVEDPALLRNHVRATTHVSGKAGTTNQELAYCPTVRGARNLGATPSQSGPIRFKSELGYRSRQVD